MKTLVVLFMAACLVGFVLVVGMGLCQKPTKDNNDAVKQLNDQQDRDVEIDGEGAKYAIYENGRLAFSTSNFKFAKDAFEALCDQTHSDITWYEYGQMIGTRKVRHIK